MSSCFIYTSDLSRIALVTTYNYIISSSNWNFNSICIIFLDDDREDDDFDEKTEGN